MTDKQQPEALRRADDLESEFAQGRISNHTGRKAATELRRLHAESEMRRAALLDEMRKAARLHAELETLRMGYKAARLEIESLQSQLHAAKQINAAQFGLLQAAIPGSVPQGKGWVVLPGQLPEPGKPVLLDIGKKYPIRALWAAKHTVQAADDDTDWGEYDEATDTYYCPEGWYEWNQNEETHWAVSETPRAWCELPLKDTQ